MKNKSTNKPKYYLWNAILSPVGLVSISKGPKKRFRQTLRRKDRILLKIKVKGPIDELADEINRIAKASEGLAMILFDRMFTDLGWEPITFATGDKDQDEELRHTIELETGIKVAL